jgi:hypothetical protein
VDLSSLSLGPEGKVHLFSPAGVRRSGQAWSKSARSERYIGFFLWRQFTIGISVCASRFDLLQSAPRRAVTSDGRFGGFSDAQTIFGTPWLLAYFIDHGHSGGRRACTLTDGRHGRGGEIIAGTDIGGVQDGDTAEPTVTPRMAPALRPLD